MKYIVEDELKINIQKKLKSTFQKTIDNPVLKAFEVWDIVSEQLLDILGPEIHGQWFKKVKPLLLKNNILLRQTQNHFAAQWINTHYQQVVEAILTTQDKKLSCFFIAPSKKPSYSNIPERK